MPSLFAKNLVSLSCIVWNDYAQQKPQRNFDMKKPKTEARVAHGLTSNHLRQTLQAVTPLDRGIPFDIHQCQLGKWEPNILSAGYCRRCDDGLLFSYEADGWIRFQLVFDGVQLADWPVTPYGDLYIADPE